MSEMIERVAKALRKADVEIENNKGFSDNHYLILAKAAIEAMREPTEEVLNAFGGHYGFTPPENRAKALPIYQAIIDAALKE